ncbi:MAG: hypothetical protein ACKVOR_02310 [Flavobacteriales bacterium]
MSILFCACNRQPSAVQNNASVVIDSIQEDITPGAPDTVSNIVKPTEEVRVESNFIIEADSVIITSFVGNVLREETDNYGNITIKEDFENNSQERKKLSRKQIETLAELLLRPIRSRLQTRFDCYNPHHAIHLHTGNSACEIELCFECYEYRTYIDCGTIQLDFNDEKWNALENFFKSCGVKRFFEK